MSEQSSIARERLVFRPQSGPAGDVLVTVMLRGGMDGLYAIPPLADPDYAKERAAFDATAPNHAEPLKLDDFFGLHASLSPLWELYQRGHLAVVHACGPTEPLLSHFDAMRLLEQGSPSGPQDGWLGRHLSAQTNPRRVHCGRSRWAHRSRWCCAGWPGLGRWVRWMICGWSCRPTGSRGS